MRSFSRGFPVAAMLAAFALVLGGAPLAIAGDHDDDHRIEIERQHKGTIKIVTVDEDGDRHEEVIELDSDEPRAFLGVSLEDADEGGARIDKVIEDSAAEAAGLREGDRIVAIDGDEVDRSWDLTRKILSAEPGQRVDLQVLRDGDRVDLSAELGEREGWFGIHLPETGKDFRFFRSGRPRLGVQLVEATPELREHFGADPDTGVLVAKVLEDMPAEEGGVEVGDLIVAIDGEPVRDAGDLVRALREAEGRRVELDLIRDGRPRAVDVFIPAEEDD